MGCVWLDSFEIQKLWGSRNLKRNVSAHVNIMHGANGTGKTTVMNLIAASIAVDVKVLDLIDFKSVKIVFRHKSKWTKPVLIVTKTQHSNGDCSYKYKIKEKTSSTGVRYTVRSSTEVRARQRYDERYYHGVSPKNRLIKNIINGLVGFSWLTVERGTFQKRDASSAVDQKLSSLLQRYQQYCSSLNRQELELKEEFQKSVFLSFLSTKRKSRFIEYSGKLDIEKEKSSLLEIYEQFGINKNEHMSRISNHFNDAEEAISRLSSKEMLSFERLLTVFDVTRTHLIIEEWNKQRTKISKLYKQKDLFFDVVNSLLHYKNIYSDRDNNICTKTDSGKPIKMSMLSSGEKQLIILLCEALLQEELPWIYIADEPELSLHVIWQELLIDSILSINPNAQIFFATHSPDIVSHYGEYTFDLEEVLDASN